MVGTPYGTERFRSANLELKQSREAAQKFFFPLKKTSSRKREATETAKQIHTSLFSSRLHSGFPQKTSAQSRSTKNPFVTYYVTNYQTPPSSFRASATFLKHLGPLSIQTLAAQQLYGNWR
jgi:hypothetical protein